MFFFSYPIIITVFIISLILVFLLVLTLSTLKNGTVYYDGKSYYGEALKETLEASPNGTYLYITYEKSKILKIKKRRGGYLCKRYEDKFSELNDIEFADNINLIFHKVDAFAKAHNAREIRFKTDLGVIKATS